MIRKIPSLFFLLVYLVTLPACATPLTYSAKEIHGQIVDAETNQPIEGAVIVAQWILFQMGIGHGGHNGRIHIHETVTDKNGNYTIPAWGPKLHSPITMLDNLDPEILIFKSGYEPRGLVNEQERTSSVRISEWDGRVIRLKKFQGTIEEYASRIGSLGIGLSHDDKDWKSFPRMVLALYAESRRLRALGLKPGYDSGIIDIDNFDAADREFLRKYKK